MATIVGIFDTQPRAEAALIRLRESGFREDDLALVANAPHQAGLGEAVRPDAAATEPRPADGTPDSEEAPKTSEDRAEEATSGAALGAAIGVIAGGGLMGPVGALLGAAVGGGVGGLLASRGIPAREALTYDERLREGHYLVAVETDGREAEVRTLLEETGAGHLQIDGTTEPSTPVTYAESQAAQDAVAPTPVPAASQRSTR
jgi:hypothetical protein